VWLTCPSCDGDVAFSTTADGGPDASYTIDTAPHELLLDLCGATAICPQCETVVTFLVKLHCNVAALPLPGGRTAYASDSAVLIAYGWTSTGATRRWQHPSSPFTLRTDAAV